MTRCRLGFPAALLLACLALPALAQAPPADADRPPTAGMLSGGRVEDRIAFAKSALKITPDQEAPWQKVAAALRENAAALDRSMQTAQQQTVPLNAERGIAVRGDIDKVLEENEKRFRAAYAPLKARLTPAQRQRADELFAADGG